jgi:CheY-like chemotaxis protein
MKENPLVLIVGHQPDHLLAYTRYLETHAPVRLVTARDGVDAVLKAKRFQPDLILLDRDHVLSLKSDPDTREIPLMLLDEGRSEEIPAPPEVLLARMQESLQQTMEAVR